MDKGIILIAKWNQVDKYLTRRALVRSLSEGISDESGIWVVIPCYGEAEFLPATLRALRACRVDPADRVAIVVVVNNRSPDAFEDETEWKAHRENLAMLEFLQRESRDFPLPLYWIDAASPAMALPGRGGVGMARKLGCDSVLAAVYRRREKRDIDQHLRQSIFLHLDADTRVEADYFAAAAELRASGQAGGAIRFAHDPADTPQQQRAIDLYEQVIHHHTRALQWAGSPYAFHTIGSTMACTFDGYVRAAGIPAKRLAGEDFYFLQQLAKVGGVTNLRRTCVHPSPRLSDRVPFGTGPRLRDALKDGDPHFEVRPMWAYEQLRRWLSTVVRNPYLPAPELLQACPSHEVRTFLEEKHFIDIWEGFCRRHRSGPDRLRAFHAWFDGLATYRLLNRLAEIRGHVSVEEGWRELTALLS